MAEINNSREESWKAESLLNIYACFLRNQENQWICFRSPSINRWVIGIWADEKLSINVQHYFINITCVKISDLGISLPPIFPHQQAVMFVSHILCIAWVEFWAWPRFVSTLAIYPCSVDTTYTLAEPGLVL